MSGWSTHAGHAVALSVDNIDTDQLIPARFMSRQRCDGYGEFLLYDFRRNSTGEVFKDFVLERFPQASILIAGRNFGSGSSREAAVYALLDAGIRVVIAPGFGDIFTANATNNALLAARVSDADHATLLSCLEDTDASALVDLKTRTITLESCSVSFQLDDASCTKLINGWDDIDLTTSHKEQIETYRQKRCHDFPWSWPTTTTL